MKYSNCKIALALCLAVAFQCSLAPETHADSKFIPDGAKFKKKDKLDFGKLLFKDSKLKDFKAIDFDKQTSTETYKAKYKGKVKKGKGKAFKPVQLKGKLSKSFKKSNKPGELKTKLVSLDLRGSTRKGKIKLGLSKNPNMPSTGLSTFTLGKEPVLVDSFFDVFFELTVNNDSPIPQIDGPSRFSLTAVPEPASLGLLLAGVAGLFVYRKRERSRNSSTPSIDD